MIPRNFYLREDLMGGRERLDENCGFIVNRIGNWNKVALGEPQILGEGAVAAENTEDGAIRAVASEALDAYATRSARGIYLADDAPAAQVAMVALHHLADEFVTRNSAVTHVTFREFKVGAADSCEAHAHDAFARRFSGFRVVAS
jgi:hypothetical protein